MKGAGFHRLLRRIFPAVRRRLSIKIQPLKNPKTPDPSPMSLKSAGPGPSRAWFYPLAACFILAALFSARQINDYDIGFHLRTGQWVVEHHGVPEKDSYTYTATQHDYTDMEWLYETGLFFLYRLFGYPALTLFNVFLILSTLGLVVLRMRLTAAPAWLYPLLLAWAIFAMETRFIVRPEILTWVLLALTLWVLEERWVGGKNLLFLLPVLQLLWVNTEGLFVLGWFVMAAYLASGRLRDKRIDPMLLKYSLGSCAVTLLNPYFGKGLAFPFILFTRTESSNPFKQLIYEFQSPWDLHPTSTQPFVDTTAILAYKVFAVFAFAAVLWTGRRRKAHEAVLLAGFFYLSAVGVRNIPLFFIVALPIAAAAAEDLLEGWRWRVEKIESFFSCRGWAAALATLLILAAGTRVATGAYYVADRRHDHFGIGLNREVLPVAAADFMRRNHLDGRLLNHFNFGGWLDWAGPSRVFIDGRSEVMQEGLFREFNDSVSPMGLGRLVSKYGIQLILNNPRAGSPWTEQLRTLGDWRLVYWDECGALYARSGYAPGLPAVRWGDVLQEKGIPEATDGLLAPLLSAPVPSRLQAFLQGFYRPQNFPFGLMNMGVFAYQNGQWEISQRLFLAGLAQSTGLFPDVYFNLGAALVKGGRYRQAQGCYEKGLALQPDNLPARQILGQLSRALNGT